MEKIRGKVVVPSLGSIRDGMLCSLPDIENNSFAIWDSNETAR